MTNRQEEFEALALPPLDAAYSLARWLSRSPTDAEDIVQEAMLRAFRAFDSLRGEAVKPWLMTIVRNCFHDYIVKARRHRPDSEVSEDAPDGGPSPEEDAATASERRKL